MKKHKCDIFGKVGDWLKQVLRFMELVGQLDIVNSSMTDEDKSLKMFCSIPPSLGGVCMAKPAH